MNGRFVVGLELFFYCVSPCRSRTSQVGRKVNGGSVSGRFVVGLELFFYCVSPCHCLTSQGGRSVNSGYCCTGIVVRFRFDFSSPILG